VQSVTAADLYLDLLARCLTRMTFEEPYEQIMRPRTRSKARVFDAVQAVLTRGGLELVRQAKAPTGREEGRDTPPQGETMIGIRRLENIRQCIVDVLERDVPGDLIETGVWRGGATIYMKGVLSAYGATGRDVWVADSFRGLPPPSGAYEADLGDPHWMYANLAVSADAVRRNFERYGLLDDHVRFLEGLFQDTLPDAPIEQLAVARFDGDMYESTIVALDALYPKLAVGGYAIVDDYGAVKGCRRAVDDYRLEHGITEPMIEIDWTGVYWQRSA
jgi:O-methyltransferase